jgi:hypothetical protein
VGHAFPDSTQSCCLPRSGIATQHSAGTALIAGESHMRELGANALLSDLCWPNFSDYRFRVATFYEAPATPWPGSEVNGQPARRSRWARRLEHFEQAGPPPSDTDLARFDIGLTVSVMRYISDLHVAKVNPRLVHFGFDVERKKYDLPGFVRDRIVNAFDIHPGKRLVNRSSADDWWSGIFEGCRKPNRSIGAN